MKETNKNIQKKIDFCNEILEDLQDELEKGTITMADINRSRIVINKKLLKLELNFNHYISKGNKEE